MVKATSTLLGILLAGCAPLPCDTDTPGTVQLSGDGKESAFFIPRSIGEDLYRRRTCQITLAMQHDAPWFSTHPDLFSYTRLDLEEDLPCTTNESGMIDCENEEVIQRVSAISPDYSAGDLIVIVDNSDDLRVHSHSYEGISSILTYMQWNVPGNSGMLAHEWAHAFAGIGDEYSHEFGGYVKGISPNCADSYDACIDKWGYLDGVECLEGCDGQEGIWRFSDDCIMHEVYRYGGPQDFCEPCEDALDTIFDEIDL
jgi:hypothetical protein